MSDRLILIVGNPVDGLRHHGPFESLDEAWQYAERHQLDMPDWWVVPLYNRDGGEG